ncbi:hydroxyacid dehydrogenase [Streptomyces aculeolatus]
MSQGKPQAAFLMRSRELRDALFTPEMRDELDRLVALTPQVVSDLRAPGAQDVLARAELLLTGWGAPALSDAQLGRMPALRAVIHSGGVAAPFLGSGRGADRIGASNAGYANSIPVAEFTQALIVLSGKQVLQTAARYRREQDAYGQGLPVHLGGNYRRTVGIVGASRVGRLLIERLRMSDFRILVHDPYLTGEEAIRLGVEHVGLDALLTGSDVVSLHVPVLPSTRGLIGRRELGLLQDGAVFINTARGAVVDQSALVDELRTGRFEAYLDTTDPEPLPREHPLYSLPNVFLTPHIAGSTGNELQRLGASVLAETRRFVAGKPFAFPERPVAAP